MIKMVGSVFLAYQNICNGCPYLHGNIFIRENHCQKCDKKKELDKKYREIKWR